MPHTTRFTVRGDKLKPLTYPSFNSGSKGYYTAKFSFDDKWDGLIPHITISENGIRRADEVIVDNTFKVPVSESGSMRLGVYGIDSEGVKCISCNEILIDVQKGAYDGTPALPSDIWEGYQITVLGYVERAEAAVRSVKNFTVSAVPGSEVKVEKIETDTGIHYEFTLPQGGTGSDNISGLKGYYIKSIDIENRKIYLTDTKSTPVISTDNNEDQSFDTPAYDVGDMFNLILKPSSDKREHYHCVATITSIANNVVGYDVDLPFTELYADDVAVDSQTFSVPRKPDVGVVDISTNSFVVGLMNIAAGEASFVTGINNLGAGKYCLVFGENNIAAYGAIAGGSEVNVFANYGAGFGRKTVVKGKRGFACGHYGEANGENSAALGDTTKANGLNALASGTYSKANGENAVAVGLTTEANGKNSLSSGQNTLADGDNSVGTGMQCKALGKLTIVGGYRSEARNPYSVALGYRAIAVADSQVVFGRDNIIDTEGKYRFIIGNGTSESKKSNAFTVDKSGNGWFAKTVTVGADNKKLATEDYVKQYVDEVILGGAW